MEIPSIPSSIHYQRMQCSDFDDVIALWRRTPGIRIADADNPEGFAAYFDRNPNLSFVARHSSGLVGTIMAGHDGRRGYLQHLAVDPEYRRRGIGTELVRRSMEALAAQGIAKAHLFVLDDNQSGKRFWQRLGWQERRDVVMHSAATPVGDDILRPPSPLSFVPPVEQSQGEKA
jgi:ribosomal protein S18 acetylase RimI-like enzyme